jgi:hypothetical protein
VLVPIYLLHRYQVQAVAKLIGGNDFRYTLRGDGQGGPSPVPADRQRAAINALIETLDADTLMLPAGLAEKIPPRPPGFARTRETFRSATGSQFDPLAPAASAATLTLQALLSPERAARMNRNGAPDFAELVSKLLDATWLPAPVADLGYDALDMQTNLLVLDGLLRLAVHDSADPSVRSAALAGVARVRSRTDRTARVTPEVLAYLRSARARIDGVLADPSTLDSMPSVTVPPGSPIGAAAGDAAGWIR